MVLVVCVYVLYSVASFGIGKVFVDAICIVVTLIYVLLNGTDFLVLDTVPVIGSFFCNITVVIVFVCYCLIGFIVIVVGIPKF